MLPMQGRIITLTYVQYFTEHVSPLEVATDFANTFNPTPTVLVLNFGLWIRNTPASCSNWTTTTDGRNPGLNCPSLPFICRFFKPHGKRNWPYHVVWQTTTPWLVHGAVKRLPRAHHMNVPHRCHVPDHLLVNRDAVLSRLEPDDRNLSRLFWPPPKGTSHALHHQAISHFLSDGNHAFNTALFEKLEALL
jgi:hypothetical protein